MTSEGHNGCFSIAQMPMNELRLGHLPLVLVGKQNGKAHQFVMSTRADSIHSTLRYSEAAQKQDTVVHKTIVNASLSLQYLLKPRH